MSLLYHVSIKLAQVFFHSSIFTMVFNWGERCSWVYLETSKIFWKWLKLWWSLQISLISLIRPGCSRKMIPEIPAPETRLEPSYVYQVVLHNPTLCGLNWIHSQTTELLVKNPVFTIFKQKFPFCQYKHFRFLLKSRRNTHSNNRTKTETKMEKQISITKKFFYNFSQCL